MFRLTLRNLLARKVRLLMSGLAIILGVAFLSGVLVFSSGLSATFDGIVKGSTPDGVVRAKAAESFDGSTGQSSGTLDPALVKQIGELPEVERADGDVAGIGLSLLAADGTLVGGTGAPTLSFNYHDAPNMYGEQIMELTRGAWPTRPDEIVMDDGSAKRGDYAVGDTVKLLAPFGKPERTARLVGTAEFNGGGTAGASLLIFSTKGAQDLFLDGRDVFNQITLTAAPGVTQTEMTSAVSVLLPDGFEAVTGDKVAKESQDQIGQFLGVISTFLLVFAVIAVLVGGFIIVNTFSILVAQRSRELALLRALGASRRQVTRSVLVEALVLSVIASTLGILLGLLLARGLAGIFRSVGLDIASSALDLSAGTVITSYVVGVVVTMLAAYLPARRAGRVAPVAAMRTDQPVIPGRLRRRSLIGGVVLVIGTGLLVLGVTGAPGPDLLWFGVGAVLWLLTVATISPIIGLPVLVLCRSLFGRLFGASGRLAGENALRDPRRTGATASALMIGLALVSTIGVLAASLNASVDDAVNEEFTSDFLVQSSNYLPFTTAVGDDLAQVDGVQTVSRQQTTAALLGKQTVYVAGNDPAFDDIYHLTMVKGRQVASGHEAAVSEGFAEKHDTTVGSTLTLAFAGDKTLKLKVIGIYENTDVTAEVSFPLDLLGDAGVARQDSSLSIMMTPGADSATVGKALDNAAKSVPIVAVYDKAEFGDSIRDQINQLLYIIYGLLALAIVIAVIGIVNTLGLSVLERTREIGLLRALGMSRRRLRQMITLESVTIAVLGALLGMVVGVAIGVLLQRALSDDLTSLGIPWTQLVVFLVIAIVVGVLAAIVPAVRASRMNVLEAIATE